MEWLTGYLDQFTYIGVAVSLFAAGLGFPIPEDIPLIFGGAMAGAGKINVYVHFVISIVFILIGDTCLYYIGRRIGSASEGKGRLARLLTPERRAKATGWFDRYGSWAVFFGRFVAGIRAAVYLTAGTVRFPVARFVVLDFLAAMVSVPVWIWLGWKFGENWEAVVETIKGAQIWVLGGVGFIALALVVYFKWWRKRRPASS
ncbi:MAG: DedA family protein [Myxococcales bacterium]|nr:DedA family protein [Myxococcales bacterium]MCB9549882.1 DedA family protein [Myxococcales bacterium]